MTDTGTDAKTERRAFEAEVGRLLDIVANALYSEREVFLRELISNAADACDRLRYEAIAAPDLMADDPKLAIRLRVDEAAGTLTISDNGVGMSRDELIANLGTIARSGSGAFLDKLTGDAKKDVSLIGQFGVGFYAAFMVASEVAVTSRRAGETDAWSWVSDGRGDYALAPAERAGRGTDIRLTLKEDAKEFLDAARLKRIVKTYSDHIPVPIELMGESDAAERLNAAAALWTLPKSEIEADQYKEFYHHAAHAFDEPWATLHFKAEGVIEYTGLLFIPTMRPMDLFDPDRKGRVKLYVKRVFITDECEALLPPWLRFLRGVIDSQDLPLNISREMLQGSPVLAKIKAGVTKRVLAELEKKAKDAAGADSYAAFWDAFGPVLKEGIYEDAGKRDALLGLARFRSTARDGWTSLADYVGRMVEGQEAIYYIAGEDIEVLKRSPQLEGFRAKGVEVLFMTDPVDEFWLPAVADFDGKPFKSVTRGTADLSGLKGADGPDGEQAGADKDAEAADDTRLATLIAKLKTALGEDVADVRKSDRLTDSAVCLVAADGGLDLNMERLLKRHNRMDAIAKRVLEVNPGHDLIKALAERPVEADVTDAAHLLLDQARILEGEPLPDPSAFARRLTAVMRQGL